MKLLVVLALLPVVLAAPTDTKRFIVGAFQVDSLFDVDALKCDVQILLDIIGADATEQACEAESRKLISEGTVFVYGIPLICHGLQNLAQYFHETPKPGDQHMACGGLNLAATTVSSV